MNEKQKQALAALCERYGAEFRESDYTVYPGTSVMMAGWAEGWVGGRAIQDQHPTIYVGCSPEGQCHS